ncbi:hypothetical protein [Methanobrevibacter sp.]|uniref:hypothetical protein n=1 Tax=Methanobrevibacter sp. TaxID=66852 RepID=UPI00388CEDC3
MILNRKNLIIFLILVGALAVVGSVYAQDLSDGDSVKATNTIKKVSAKSTKKVTVKIYNFKPGVLWGPKAVKLKNGDAIVGYVTYTGNSQFDKGTGVTAWYIGNGLNGDMVPHHTKLIKAKFYFKNSKGKIKTKTVTGASGHIQTKLINGYTPYKAVVYYQTK